MSDIMVHRCAYCAISTKLRTATCGLGRWKREVAVLTPPPSGARLKPDPLVCLADFLSDSNARFSASGLSGGSADSAWLGAGGSNSDALSLLQRLLAGRRVDPILLINALHCEEDTARGGSTSLTTLLGSALSGNLLWWLCLLVLPPHVLPR